MGFFRRLRRVLVVLATILALLTLGKRLLASHIGTCPSAPEAPPPAHTSFLHHSCEDDVCSYYLTGREKNDYSSCTARVADFKIEPSNCRFMNGSGRKPVALASFPGSGNTWVRGLLQLATGICTGSLYCDKTLRRGGFPGEGVRSGSVLVVKTHKWKSRNRRVYSNFTEHFSAAIFIVRNPFHALVSERHRMASLRHTDAIGSEYFGANTSWNKFVKGHSFYWEKMVNFWVGTLTQRRVPLLVVRFEKLRENTMRELKRMVEFLGVRIEEDELATRLGKGFDLYKRKHHDNFIHYTANQIEIVRKHVLRVRMNLATIKHQLPLEEYMNQ